MKALITGANGQDARWLTKFLLEHGYEVHLTDRRRSQQNMLNERRCTLHRMNLMDESSIRKTIKRVRPEEIYHLAAQSHVGWSFEVPEETMASNTMGTLYLLEAMKEYCPSSRMYFAATSEMFGGLKNIQKEIYCREHDCTVNDFGHYQICPIGGTISLKEPMLMEDIKQAREKIHIFGRSGFIQDASTLTEVKGIKPCTDAWEEKDLPIPLDENSPMIPKSPYGVSKTASYQLIALYRQAYNMRICSGILFNHESKYRGNEFLPMKVCNYVKKFHVSYTQAGTISETLKIVGGPLEVGNVLSARDWGWAKEYVEAMYRILHQDEFRCRYIETERNTHLEGKDFHDYVVGTGMTTTIRDFIAIAFKHAGFDGEWHGAESQTTAADASFNVEGYAVVGINPQFFRPAEVHVLRANPIRALRELGWKASDNSVDLIIKDMLEN